MKKIAGIVLTCIVFFMQLGWGAFASETVGSAFNLEKVHLLNHEKKKITNKVIKKGSVIELLGKEDAWYKVLFDGQIGYLEADSLHIVDSSSGQNEMKATGGVQFYCKAAHPFHLRKEADEKAGTFQLIKKDQALQVLSYAGKWCLVATEDGKHKGYAKTDRLFHFRSADPFQYELPAYTPYKMNGFLKLEKDFFVGEGTKSYLGNTLHEGDILAVFQNAEGDLHTVLRRTLHRIPKDIGRFEAIVPWKKAKEGDVISVYTQFYGRNQGGKLAGNRKNNISRALEKLHNLVLQPGEEFSYLTAIGPLKPGNGYQKAPIIGGKGVGTGGGVCHSSTLLYQTALALPFTFTEREPHTKNGTTYAPLELDSLVGRYSDLRFVNTLPYPVRMETYTNQSSGIMTIKIICMQTVEDSVLSKWRGQSSAKSP